MFRAGLIPAAVVLGSLSAASAQRGILTEGVTDCGLWVTARKAGLASNLEHHLIGTLNGMALGRAIEFWQAGGIKISREQAYLWMDKFCTDNPLGDVTQGAFLLMDEHSHGAYSANPPKHWRPQE